MVVVVMLAGWLETSRARMLASVVDWLGGVRVVVVATWPYLNFAKTRKPEAATTTANRPPATAAS